MLINSIKFNSGFLILSTKVTLNIKHAIDNNAGTNYDIDGTLSNNKYECQTDVDFRQLCEKYKGKFENFKLIVNITINNQIFFYHINDSSICKSFITNTTNNSKNHPPAPPNIIVKPDQHFVSISQTNKIIQNVYNGEQIIHDIERDEDDDEMVKISYKECNNCEINYYLVESDLLDDIPVDNEGKVDKNGKHRLDKNTQKKSFERKTQLSVREATAKENAMADQIKQLKEYIYKQQKISGQQLQQDPSKMLESLLRHQRQYGNQYSNYPYENVLI